MSFPLLNISVYFVFLLKEFSVNGKYEESSDIDACVFNHRMINKKGETDMSYAHRDAARIS